MTSNIDDLTIGQFKALFSALLGNGAHGAVGKKCIVRTFASGVHFGLVESVAENGGRSRCVLSNARRLYMWKTKIGPSLSDLAQGIDIKDSQVCAVVPTHYIEDAIEFIPVADEVAEDIMAVGASK